MAQWKSSISRFRRMGDYEPASIFTTSQFAREQPYHFKGSRASCTQSALQRSTTTLCKCRRLCKSIGKHSLASNCKPHLIPFVFVLLPHCTPLASGVL